MRWQDRQASASRTYKNEGWAHLIWDRSVTHSPNHFWPVASTSPIYRVNLVPTPHIQSKYNTLYFQQAFIWNYTKYFNWRALDTILKLKCNSKPVPWEWFSLKPSWKRQLNRTEQVICTRTHTHTLFWAFIKSEDTNFSPDKVIFCEINTCAMKTNNS